MATAALRAGLVIAAVVLGVFVLTKAFPTQSAIEPPPAIDESPSDGESPSAPESPEETPDEPARTPEIEGVTVVVLNGTRVTGLAAKVEDELRNRGYDVIEVANAQALYETTSLFFRDAQSKVEAQELRSSFFTRIRPDLQRTTDEFNPDVQVTIVLGADYAEAQA